MAIKVCHMTSTHRAKDQRIFHKQCVSLANAGYDVYLVEQGPSEETNGVHIVGTQEEDAGRFYRLLKRPRHVYKLAKALDADIYQIHDMELLPFALKLKRQGKKVIFDSHEDFATSFADSDALPVPGFVKKFLGKMYNCYERYVVKRLNAVISVTPHICERLKKNNPNTVMVTNYPILDAGEWKENMSYHPESDYIAFAGQISDTYSIPMIVESMKDIADVKLRICGPARVAAETERMERWQQEGLVTYLGLLPFAQIPGFFNQSKAAVVLPVCNSFTGGKVGTLGSNKLFEAMLCGVPVICTNFTLWQEIIDKYHCGICVDPEDAEQFKAAVRYIASHPEDAAEMGQNGRNAVLEQYNWASQEAVLLELYKKLH